MFWKKLKPNCVLNILNLSQMIRGGAKSGLLRTIKFQEWLDALMAPTLDYKSPRSTSICNYFNRKGFHSINAMLICDHTTKILAINCQYGGAAHDSFIWKHSNERMVMEHRFLHNRSDNAWLLGDSGYPLEPWCITPYRNPSDGSGEARFNEIHSKARCIIERTNGVLKGRWRILEYNKRGRYDHIKVARFANVCAALHNICIQYNVSFTATNSESQTASDIVSEEGQYTRIDQTIRDQIKMSLMNST
ncbi:putative nuclease HARBI1 [Anastrepha ludens]|uniref:putative nuclease HARBI1 n=1 Tax=Anastrepha ludens TaxID=28586 RepID=UPI0023B1A772|nr:putative nuclease HARBI1 [Anastrepha ludens]